MRARSVCPFRVVASRSLTLEPSSCRGSTTPKPGACTSRRALGRPSSRFGSSPDPRRRSSSFGGGTRLCRRRRSRLDPRLQDGRSGARCVRRHAQIILPYNAIAGGRLASGSRVCAGSVAHAVLQRCAPCAGPVMSEDPRTLRLAKPMTRADDANDGDARRRRQCQRS